MKEICFCVTALLLFAALLLASSPLLIREMPPVRQTAEATETGSAEESERSEEGSPSCGTSVLPFFLAASDHFPDAEIRAVPAPREESAAPPEGSLPIVTKNMSPSDSLILLSNETKFRPDTAALALKELHIPAALPAFAESGKSDAAPLVLILHTHASEAYSPDGAEYVLPGQNFYSSDPEQNILAVGEVFCGELNRLGIPAIQSRALHNDPAGGNAYKQAKKTIAEALARYPSIRYILDLHRDSIVTSDGTHYRPITVIDGEPVAQLMFVMGTNEAGAAHPDWETNLALACRLQKHLSTFAPALTRPLNLRRASFNEQYTPGSMLIEVGSDANSLPEAKRAALLLARGLADVIRDISE